LQEIASCGKIPSESTVLLAVKESRGDDKLVARYDPAKLRKEGIELPKKTGGQA
jgi:hypothetical protein